MTRAKPGHGHVIRTCAHCGGQFTRPGSQLRWEHAHQRPEAGTFCSGRCRAAAHRVTLTCAGCGKQFEEIAARARKRRYCSQACAPNAPKPRVTLSCSICSTPFTCRRYSQARTRVTCSRACAAKHFSRVRRDRARADGREDRYRLGSRDWRRTRVRVIARDGGRCHDCGTRARLSVHHLTGWKQSRDDSDANLLTLCRSCHARWDAAQQRR